jgi:hypothetical protein
MTMSAELLKWRWQREFTRRQLTDPELDPYETEWGCTRTQIDHLLKMDIPLEHAAAVRGILIDGVWWWGCSSLHDQMAHDVGGVLQARYRKQYPLLPVIEFENVHSKEKGAQCDIFQATRSLLSTTPILATDLINIKTRVGTFLSVKDLFTSLGQTF